MVSFPAASVIFGLAVGGSGLDAFVDAGSGSGWIRMCVCVCTVPRTYRTLSDRLEVMLFCCFYVYVVVAHGGAHGAGGV